MTRRSRISWWMLCLWLLAHAASALQMIDHYSPRNASRPARASTRYVVLHTTEAPDAGSLNKLTRYGECHYLVASDGRIYRIIHRNRVAMHAGRSLWNGVHNLDEHSIGVEVVGYHNRAINRAQKTALRELLRQLQGIYNVPDENVLCHSMVAYGSPNKWHKRPHRGRKRCGMQFADPSLRRELGLNSQPLEDPDVKAGRLAVGDAELARVLYGDPAARRRALALLSGAAEGGDLVLGRRQAAWDLVRERYNAPATLYIFPDGSRRTGDAIRDWTSMPAGTRIRVSEVHENAAEPVRVLGRDGKTASELAGDMYNDAACLYVDATGGVRQGHRMRSSDFSRLPEGTRILVGYREAGRVSASRSAYQLVSYRWRDSSTYYLMPDGTLTPGDRVEETRIPQGSRIFVPQ